jgi:hypothetical protein
MEAINEPARAAPGVGATPDLDQTVLDAYRHPLIEDKTFA